MKNGLIVALCLPLLTSAQILEVTPNTPCGAPGVGLVRKIADGAEKWVPEQRLVGTPGQYVGKTGRWLAGCKMPPACQERVVYQWAEQHDDRSALCTANVKRIRAGDLGQIRQVHGIDSDGTIIGRATYECTKDGWALSQRPTETYCRRSPNR